MKIRQTCLDPREFVQMLEQTVERLTAGKPLEISELLPLLAHPEVENRLEATLALIMVFMQKGDEERVGQLVERAWWLSRQSPKWLDTYLYFKIKVGDMAAVRGAYKHQGMRATREGRLAEALTWFNCWQGAENAIKSRDYYYYDEDILAAIDQLAAPYRFSVHPSSPVAGERIRLAYLMHGVTQFNSALVRLSRLFADHHDRGRFEVAFFVPDSRADVLASPQGQANLQAMAEQGWHVCVAPDSDDDAEMLLGLARSIHGFRPHLMVLNAGLGDMRHHFIRALRPASRTIGFLSGPPAQFVAPDLDAAIAWTWHPLMDCPVPCYRVAPEINLPGPDSVRPVSRASLGIPDGAVLLAAGGRHVKFRSPLFWQLVDACLQNHPEVWFMIIGAEEGQLKDMLAALPVWVRSRLVVIPWLEEYLTFLASADIQLDTYPSGGGAILLDGMAMGIPTVAFENDYLHSFDQSDWSPAQEMLPDACLVSPRGDIQAFLTRIEQLINCPELRRQMGEKCSLEAKERFGRPQRMVTACEQLYARILGLPENSLFS